MKVLVLGANGMLGNAMIRVLSDNNELDVYGTVRDEAKRALLPERILPKIIDNIDVGECNLLGLFKQTRPDVVVNCVGSINKDFKNIDSVIQAISLNALLPHRLYKYCEKFNSRLIHISTDCVFSGNKGNYKESDATDPVDAYGESKHLGEIDRPQAITLRTSIIGHELKTARGLLEWFLSQQEACNGYAKAIFSGLPTVILAEVIRDHVITNTDLSGLYHIAGPAIAKYELLKIIAKEYNKKIDINYDETLNINRSLNADKFTEATGYVAPAWPSLIQSMHNYN